MTAPALRPVPVTPQDEPAALADNTAEKQPRSPRCLLSGEVSADRATAVKLDHEPGALLAVFGDRSEASAGEERLAGPFTLSAANDLLQIALAGQKLEPGPLPVDRVNAMMQAMSAFEPTNELEGMIAMQATALHVASMDSIRRSLAAGNDAVRSSCLSQANKCSRTFATLVEALARHRGKTTTQRVIVENVTVHPGGQAVVGAVAGVGSKQSGVVQTHEQPQTIEIVEDAGGQGRAALPRPQQIGQSVSATGDEGKTAVSPSRGRGRNRRAKGQPKSVDARSLQRVGNRRATDDPSAAAKRERSDLVGAP
ncbi:MAG: hypothetical protein K2X34_06080 [Hyphomonadaceae bacterium]|nr:hypothetical protein [Hyphomonadaceae bacterium]